MKKDNRNYFLISPVVMWLLLALNYFFAILWLTKSELFYNSGFLSGAAFSVAILTLIIFLSDIIVSPVYNRSFWIISVVFISMITYPVYLIQRKKLQRLYFKFRETRA